VEISTLKVMPDGKNDIKTRRLNPEIPIPPEASAVHGIYDADVANEPTFGKIARSLVMYLEGCDLCGYNLWSFDLKLLANEFNRVGVPFSDDGRYVVDPCRIYHRRERRDLTAALRFYCGREHDGAHSAAADVLAALLVLDGQAERYEDLPRTIPELHAHMEYPELLDPEGKFERRADGAIVFQFSNHRGRSVDEVARTDPGFLEWVVKKAFSDEATAIAREALDRRRAEQGIPMYVD
jgi:DNA polymerase-3 subunit epsilon